MIELKPCAKCGLMPELSIDKETFTVSVVCPKCHEREYASLVDDVCSAWNDEQAYKECHTNDGELIAPEEINLLPCPFCGGEAYMTKWGVTDEFSVFCRECCAGVEDLKSPQDAMAAWNRRSAS